MPSIPSIVRNSMLLLLATAGSVVSGETIGSTIPGAADPLARWRNKVTVRAVLPNGERHTIHSYYVCNPESPDGRRLLYFSATSANAHVGDLCMLDRQTNKETTLVREISVEDAHRVACQQWISGGRRIAFHDVKDGRWSVSVVDVETLERRVLIEDRQLGFGQPNGDLLPVYGCHWNPGEHRDLELINAATGERRTAVTAAAVQEKYGAWLTKEFAGKPISLFFPVLSPDAKRVFFKIAAGNGGNEFQSKNASRRQGLLVFDLEANRLTYQREKWGHPAWHPDSRRIIEVGNILIDSLDGSVARIPEEPNLPGSHPSMSADETLFVTDGQMTPFGGESTEWGVMVGDIRGKQHILLHRFQNNLGARSWRVSHPHPAFSADGNRIYFNVSNGKWTQLYVAEAASSAP